MRKLFVVLVLAVMVSLGLASCAPVVVPPSADLAFWGTWVSEDPDTLGITRVEIERWAIHMWGSCEPTDCDWGEAPYAIHEDELRVVWDHGYAIRVQVLALQPGGFLRIETTTTYTDGSGSRIDIDILLRQVGALP